MAKSTAILGRIDWKYLLISLLLLLTSAIVYIFREECLNMVQWFFDIEDLNIFAGGVATIFTLTQKIKTRKLNFRKSMSFSEFRVPLEDGFSFIGNPITLVCAISLAKGALLYSEKYFPEFTPIEVTFIGLVAAYLLFISIMELLSNIKETLVITIQGKQELKAVPVDEAQKETPKPLHLQ